LAGSPHGGNIDSLSLDGTTLSNSLRVLPGASGLHCLDEDTKWVLVGLEVDKFESLLNNQTSLKFFTTVTAVEHKGVDETFNDGTLGLSETEDLVFSSGVG